MFRFIVSCTWSRGHFPGSSYRARGHFPLRRFRRPRDPLLPFSIPGSERVGKSGAQGDRLKEAQNINKSLSALGDCVQSLVAKSKHVPFRNSKLTYLLQVVDPQTTALPHSLRSRPSLPSPSSFMTPARSSAHPLSPPPYCPHNLTSLLPSFPDPTGLSRWRLQGAHVCLRLSRRARRV